MGVAGSAYSGAAYIAGRGSREFWEEAPDVRGAALGPREWETRRRQRTREVPMAVAVQCTYAGGDGRLAHTFQGTLNASPEVISFAYEQVWFEGITANSRQGGLDWPMDEVLGLSVADVAHYRGLTIGGLVPVGDDLLAGALGEIGGGSSALVLVLARGEEAGGRRLIRFACTAPNAQAFVNGTQRERLTAGLEPLPGVEEVDARSRADDERTVLTELRNLAREQVELLKIIADRLGTRA
jgi:hypothetical protein